MTKQTITFQTTFSDNSGVGGRVFQGIGLDFRLRKNQRVASYLFGFRINGNILSITLSGNLRGGNRGDNEFSDLFVNDGYVLISQNNRQIEIDVSGSNPTYTPTGLDIDLTNTPDVNDFVSNFQITPTTFTIQDFSPPIQYDPIVGWASEITGIGLSKTPFRLWSGEGLLSVSGKSYQGTTYSGGALIAVETSPISIGENTSRAKITMAVPTSAIREMLSIDVGPVWIDAFNIISNDNGKTWKRLPTGIAGRLSKPFFDVEGSLYNVEIETYSGDSDRGVPLLWSDESLRADYPDDLGFEFMRNYETGVDIKWPP